MWGIALKLFRPGSADHIWAMGLMLDTAGLTFSFYMANPDANNKQQALLVPEGKPQIVPKKTSFLDLTVALRAVFVWSTVWW